jgi:predicted DNA-binding transcriptional regulator AlpA
MKQAPSPRRRVGIKAVRNRYNRSDVTIWTWYSKHNFPKPHYINGQRQWWEDELDDYDAEHAQTYEERRGSA